jgi:hypothetical protein
VLGLGVLLAPTVVELAAALAKVDPLALLDQVVLAVPMRAVAVFRVELFLFASRGRR